MPVSKDCLTSPGSGSGTDGEKKALRSCARCRRNKTKCDSVDTRPNPCSSCVRKGVECHIDYVAPPQRSREMKVLYENIRFARGRITSLSTIYDSLLKDAKVDERQKIKPNMKCPTRILKVDGKYFVFNLNQSDDSLYVNNLKIDGVLLKKSFENFRTVLSNLLKIYFKWEKIDEFTIEKADVYVSQFDVESLLKRSQLLLLLGILNFYFDIPGFKYLDIFNHVIESYYCGASGLNEQVDGSNRFNKSMLAKLIIGIVPNAQFHSEMFIKHFTIYLFLHIVLYGPEYFMGCFMDKYIRTLESLRKKINFDKNWEVKWVNFYIRLLNLVESDVVDESGLKSMVDEDEVEYLFSLAKKELACETNEAGLDCFICLLKFNQYVIERRMWPDKKYVKDNLLGICQKLMCDLVGVFYGNGGLETDKVERYTFVHLFFTQLVTLNMVACANHCGGSINDFDSKVTFNGFNHSMLVSTFNEVGGEVKKGDKYYCCQLKYEYLKLAVSKCLDGDVSDNFLKLVEVPVGKNYCKVNKDKGVVDMIESEVQSYFSQNDMSLNILKSSCKFIWYFYEFVIFWNMLDRMIEYEPFIWNAQLLVENNGLEAQSGDVRGLWSGDDSCNDNDNIQNGVDDVKEIGIVSLLPRRCKSETSYFDGDEKKLSLDDEVKQKDVQGVTSESMNSSGGETCRQLGGGINRILQDVDWVKESADDVLRKIHGVLN